MKYPTDPSVFGIKMKLEKYSTVPVNYSKIHSALAEIPHRQEIYVREKGSKSRNFALTAMISRLPVSKHRQTVGDRADFISTPIPMHWIIC
jgi:hypothetical protein